MNTNEEVVYPDPLEEVIEETSKGKPPSLLLEWMTEKEFDSKENEHVNGNYIGYYWNMSKITESVGTRYNLCE